MADSQGVLGGLQRGSMEDPPTGGARPGNGAISRLVDKQSRFLFYTRLGSRTKSLAEIPPGKGRELDPVIAAQDCIILKEANYTTLLGRQDKPSAPGHCSESSGTQSSFQNRPEARTRHNFPSQA